MPFELGFKKVIMFSNGDPEVDACRKEEVFREKVRKPGMKGKDSQISGQYSRNRRSALRLQVNEHNSSMSPSAAGGLPKRFRDAQ